MVLSSGHRYKLHLSSDEAFRDWVYLSSSEASVFAASMVCLRFTADWLRCVFVLVAVVEFRARDSNGECTRINLLLCDEQLAHVVA